ncbi:MAG: hypothetical protein KDB11_25375, partial [Planctomycetales bacterium]|nr:hypothetical protein [Planctomycetales bacterium]
DVRRHLQQPAGCYRIPSSETFFGNLVGLIFGGIERRRGSLEPRDPVDRGRLQTDNDAIRDSIATSVQICHRNDDVASLPFNALSPVP